MRRVDSKVSGSEEEVTYSAILTVLQLTSVLALVSVGSGGQDESTSDMSTRAIPSVTRRDFVAVESRGVLRNSSMGSVRLGSLTEPVARLAFELGQSRRYRALLLPESTRV